MDTTIDQQRERLQQQLAELELREREAEAVRAVREAEAEAHRAAAVDAHRALELEHADELAALREALDDAREGLGKAVTNAIEVLCEVWDQAQRYNELVTAAADDLRDAGLHARWEEADRVERFDTGSCENRFGGPLLLLSGTAWHEVHPQLVAAYVLEAVVAGRLPGAGNKQRTGPAVDLLDPVTKRPKAVPAPHAQMPVAPVASDFNAPVSVNGKTWYQGAAKG